MKTFYLILTLLITCVFPLKAESAKGERWTEEKAQKWAADNPWFCGFNYIPSSAVNYTAMWQKSSFDPETIDKELSLAEKLGFNCVRVVLQELVWLDNPEEFYSTFDKFLNICERHGIKVMPCFFDDCIYDENVDPKLGKQVEPKIGWYASGWSPSPGHTKVKESKYHAELENYVKSVMTRFKNDKRIMLWDLYNEPTNGGLGAWSIPLAVKTLEWARDVNPSQPLSIGIWGGVPEAEQYFLDNSDIITFHCYKGLNETKAVVEPLKKYNRPILCTEWLNRTNSPVKEILPYLVENNIGALHWGLVQGKTQTNLPWGHRPEMLPYKGKPQHDLFDSQFKPYDPEEIELFKSLIREKNPK